jgi:hypothetical protein
LFQFHINHIRGVCVWCPLISSSLYHTTITNKWTRILVITHTNNELYRQDQRWPGEQTNVVMPFSKAGLWSTNEIVRKTTEVSIAPLASIDPARLKWSNEKWPRQLSGGCSHVVLSLPS